MTLKELMAWQRERNMCDVHVAWLGRTSFHLAHTDDERAAGTNTEACPYHRWLADCDGSPVPATGIYVMTPHMPDAYSEPLGAEPYDFELAALALRTTGGTDG